jgi:hypothetical protein
VLDVALRRIDLGLAFSRRKTTADTSRASSTRGQSPTTSPRRSMAGSSG